MLGLHLIHLSERFMSYLNMNVIDSTYTDMIFSQIGQVSFASTSDEAHNCPVYISDMKTIS